MGDGYHPTLRRCAVNPCRQCGAWKAETEHGLCPSCAEVRARNPVGTNARNKKGRCGSTTKTMAATMREGLIRDYGIEWVKRNEALARQMGKQ